MNELAVNGKAPQLKPEWENSPGAQAIQALVGVCVRHRGGGTYPIIDFLLGLYNGDLWKPDMQFLCRRIDDDQFELVVKAMRLTRQTDRRPQAKSKPGIKTLITMLVKNRGWADGLGRRIASIAIASDGVMRKHLKPEFT